MRKVLAWLCGATLLLVCSLAGSDGGGTSLKPYVTLILDTSGSMSEATGFGSPTCGNHCSTSTNTLCHVNGDCPATETCVAPADQKFFHAKCAINNIANSYGEIVFALGRYRATQAGTVSGIFPNGCTDSGGTCSATDDNFELLTSLVDGGNGAAAKWTNFTGNTCDGTGTEPEIWKDPSSTPLGGSLLGAQRYYEGLQASNGTTTIWPSTSAGFDPILNDPPNSVFLPRGSDPSATSASSRAGNVVTVTTASTHAIQATQSVVIAGVTGGTTAFNGTFTATTAPDTTHITYAQTGANESGTANTGTASHAAFLFNYQVQTKVIGFGVTPGDANIEAIAHGGGAPDVPNVNEGYYVADEVGLELAISDIIAKSIRSETCTNLDDACDTRVAAAFPTTGAACSNGEKGVCLVNGHNICRSDGTGVACDAGTVGDSPDCSGQPDGTACAGVNAANASVTGKCSAGVCDPFLVQGSATELCTGLDDDCDGKVDAGLPGCVCTPQAELSDGAAQNCDTHPDQTCTCSNAPHGTCKVNGDCGTGNSCVCAPLIRNCCTGTCLGTQTCGETNGDGTFD